LMDLVNPSYWKSRWRIHAVSAAICAIHISENTWDC
jgi:hypothetical protein